MDSHQFGSDHLKLKSRNERRVKSGKKDSANTVGAEVLTSV
jgi:hypothetical protein